MFKNSCFKGARIYAVQCMANSSASYFYEHLAKATTGKHLNLDAFGTIVDMMMAICYRETGPEFFEVTIIYIGLYFIIFDDLTKVAFCNLRISFLFILTNHACNTMALTINNMYLILCQCNCFL